VTAPQTARLNRGAETLFRQVHPTQFPGGVISKEASIPTQTDQGLLSTLRESAGAQEAHRRWTEDEKRESIGTYGITIAEVDGAGVFAVDDAAATNTPDHASVDFNGLTTGGQRKKAARQLRDHATSRGCLYWLFTDEGVEVGRVAAGFGVEVSRGWEFSYCPAEGPRRCRTLPLPALI